MIKHVLDAMMLIIFKLPMTINANAILSFG